MSSPATRAAAGPPAQAGPAWKVLGASVTGRSHEAAGKGCEDASDWLAQPGLTCLAVADGAGSRLMARDGAVIAVRSALQTAVALATGQTAAAGVSPGSGGPGDGGGPGQPGHPDDLAAWLRLIFADAQKQLTTQAMADLRDVGDYATTLAVAILTDEMIGLGQVGDSIVVCGNAGRYETVAPAPRSEYPNETTFITGPGDLDELRIMVTQAAEVDAVFLSTDGLRFKILDDMAAATPFTPFFEDLHAYVRSPSATQEAVSRFLAGLDDQSGDDKTLLAAVRTPAN